MRSEIAPFCVTNLEKKGLFSLEAHVLGKPMADLRNEIVNKTLQWRFNTATYSTIWPAPDVYRNEGCIICIVICRDYFWNRELLVRWRKALANFNKVTCMFLAAMKIYKSDNIFYLSFYFFTFLKPIHFVLGRVKQTNIIFKRRDWNVHWVTFIYRGY